jgi:hypothetical protein
MTGFPAGRRGRGRAHGRERWQRPDRLVRVIPALFTTFLIRLTPRLRLSLGLSFQHAGDGSP